MEKEKVGLDDGPPAKKTKHDPESTSKNTEMEKVMEMLTRFKSRIEDERKALKRKVDILLVRDAELDDILARLKSAVKHIDDK